MAVDALTEPRAAAAPLSRPLELVCFALIVAQAVYLAASYLQGIWLIAPDGGGIATDFVAVWAAGKLALAGHAVAVYDWPVHKAVEVMAVGHPFAGYFGWHYPPTFLFVAVVLSLMPYAPALALWVFATFPAYLVAIRAIVGDRTGYILAAAFPAVLCNFIDGQNGFLSAALIGGTLFYLPKRPVLAGVLLGLLTYKPHLGILFPIVLAMDGRWRTFASAGVTAMLMAMVAWLAFGTGAWQAFVGNIGHTSEAFLSDGWADWAKLQSAFGLVRTLGAPQWLAWTVQAVLALAVATAVTALWRSNKPYALKAAALGTGAVLATPYLYTYDLAVLAVPLAFLFKLGRAQGFLKGETAAIGVACLLIAIFPFVTAPVGFTAALIVAALVARRVLTPRHEMTAPAAA
jgi:arabinofuranan 3-O-arabinosyltransferase